MTKRTKVIRTEAPSKGDLVVGHRVYAFFPNLPAVPGKIAAVSDSGHAVTFEVEEALAIIGGLPRRTEWTWRRAVNAYQPKTDKTKQGVGLALVKR